MSTRVTPQNKSPILFLLGPTATGKTACALRLAERFPNLLLISVDSAMVYRRMDIGTGKPTAEELRQAPHRLIDIREPWETYSAADFCQDALQAIAEAHAQNRIPLLVGGTFLYFKALQYGLSDLPTANPAIRAAIAAEAAAIGWPDLHAELQRIDRIASERIKPNDSQRITRALEVYRLTGKPLSAWHGKPTAATATAANTVHPSHTLVLRPNDRALLHTNIEKRFQNMVEQGLVDEVRALLQEEKINADLPAMRAVGYRQICDYIQSQHTDHPMALDTAVTQGMAATRQLAKRQLTWLRGLQQDTLVCFEEAENLVQYASAWLEKI